MAAINVSPSAGWKQYDREMREMVRRGAERLAKRYPRLQIFTVAIWTDPTARFSCIAVDTKQHSSKVLREHVKFIEEMQQYAPDICDPPTKEEIKAVRARNPASFKIPELATCQHAQFTRPLQWKRLLTALRRIQDFCIATFADRPLHPDAVVSINGPKDWFTGEKYFR